MFSNAHRLSLPRQIEAVDSYLDSADHSNQAIATLDALGREDLAEGKVGILMMAGGISSRWGQASPRGEVGIGPVSEKPLFQLQFERILASNRRYRRRLRCLVMVSEMVRDDLVESFASHNYFGLERDDIWFFCQESLPVVNSDSRVYQDRQGESLLCPGGHGGMLAALGSSGYLQSLIDEGVRYLFSFQYPNVLEKICDPVMLGYHRHGNFEVTAKGFRECQPGEKLGRLVVSEGGLQVVEYHAVPRQRPAWWDDAPANLGTYVWNVEFLARCLDQKIELPYYRLPFRLTDDDSRPLYKLEQFVFDLLPHARGAGLVLVKRTEEYTAVKSQDSIEAAREALCQLYKQWLNAAGARPRHAGCRVEISPLFALDQTELAKRIPAGFVYDDGLELR